MAELKDGKFVDNVPTSALPTRAQYLNGEVTMEEYYSAVARTAHVSFANANSEFLDRVRQALERGDAHLNSIPLAVWDGYSIMAKSATAPAFKAHGDFWSIAGGVCLAKTAARNAV